MISAFNLLIALRKAKILANGTAPIYLRVTIEGYRLDLLLNGTLIHSAGMLPIRKWEDFTRKPVP